MQAGTSMIPQVEFFRRTGISSFDLLAYGQCGGVTIDRWVHREGGGASHCRDGGNQCGSDFALRPLVELFVE